MPLYSGNKKYGIVKSVNTSNLEEKSIYKNGVYTPSTGYDGFSKVDVSVTYSDSIKSPYADEYGNFVKPNEWDDIESIEINENSQEAYYLYDNTISFSFCSLRCYGTGLTCEYGRVINGQFTSYTSETISSGGYFRRCLTDDFPNDDYIVLKITGTSITRIEPSTFAYNNRTLALAQQRILMRYGNLPNAQIIPCAVYSLVSDNVMNCKALTTLASMYSTCYCLIRHRHTGWDTKDVTTASSFFGSCSLLTDIDRDFSGWFANGKITTMSGMFSGCMSLKGEIDVTNWNSTNTSNISSIFYNCYNLTKIKGIETWYLPKVTMGSNYRPFSGCYSLYQEDGKLDLSNWMLGETSTGTHNLSSIFSSCFKLEEIDISTWKLTNTSTMSSMFSGCYNLKKVSLPEIGGALTTIASAFAECRSLESIDFSKVDVSKVTSMNATFTSCNNLKTAIMPTTTPVGSASANLIGSWINYAFLLTDLDLSWLDASKFTASASQIATMLTGCYSMKNLKPPININKNFSVADCTNLTRESVLLIINNLLNVTTATTLTLGASNCAKLTDDEIAVATGKGWTVA